MPRTQEEFHRLMDELGAAFDGHEVAMALIRQARKDQNVNPEETTTTLLHLASFLGMKRFVQQLLELGANAKAKDNANRTALHLCCRQGDLDIARVLCSHVNNSSSEHECRQMPKKKVGSDCDTPVQAEASGSGGTTTEADIPNLQSYVDLKDSTGQTSLHYASRAGNLKLVKELVACQADTSIVSCKGLTPMCVACLFAQLDVAKFLYSKHTHPKSETQKKCIATPLHCAVRAGSVEITNFLLSKGININMRDYKGKTPLHVSCAEGHVVLTDLLLKRGAQVNLQSKRESPLHTAVSRRDNMKVVKSLLVFGANVNANDSSQISVLYRSCFVGDMPVVALLLKKGAIINTGTNPLIAAIKGDHYDIVEKLIECGVDINATDQFLDSALHYACKGCTRKAFKIAKMLVEKGANVNAKNSSSNTPLNIAASRKNSISVVKMLLDKSADLENMSDMGETPLHQAICYSDPEVVELLLVRGANVNAPGLFKKTPLHHAVERQSVHLVKELLDAQADTKAKTIFGMTPLHMACDIQNVDVTHCLLIYGASVHDIDQRGRTPLHKAVVQGNVQTVELLLKFKALLEVPDMYGQTPLDLARLSKHEELIEVLENPKQ